MDKLTFLKEYVKTYNNYKCLNFNILVISNHGITDDLLEKLIPQLSKYKVILYTLSDGRFLLYRSGFPSQKYKISYQKNLMKLEVNSVSKNYLEYLTSLIKDDVKISITYSRCKNTSPKVLSLFNDDTHIDHFTTTMLPLGEWVRKSLGPDITYDQVGSYKFVYSRKVSINSIIKQSSAALKKITYLNDDGIDYCNSDHINELVSLRLRANLESAKRYKDGMDEVKQPL